MDTETVRAISQFETINADNMSPEELYEKLSEGFCRILTHD